MENTENRLNMEIDMKRLLLAMWRRVWLILLVSILCGALAFTFAWIFIAPTYASSVQLYVNNNYSDSPGFSSSQLVAAQELAATYMVIMESRSVLGEVAKQTNLGYTYEELTRMVSAASVNKTEVFQITVKCGDYRHAARIANTIADILPEKIAAVVEGSSVRVVDYAVEDPRPVGTSDRRYAIMGAAAGFLLCSFVVIVADLLDTTILSVDYINQTYAKVPLLAVIPGAQNPKSGYHRGNYEAEKRPVRKNGGAR